MSLDVPLEKRDSLVEILVTVSHHRLYEKPPVKWSVSRRISNYVTQGDWSLDKDIHFLF
jgi:hypothetical protein